ncbi:hypothetical protein [Lentisalinibacter salinarum]|uniref:hypothetical protein n=1 Tax=Lentisalinibacter salinarum TaxID=2992239 RepID=UPI00386D0266
MKSRLKLVPLALLLALTGVSLANADAPNFGPAIYGDGEVWGTKGLGELPAPNGRNNQSFDKLFIFVNGAAGQLPVSEAAPGNRAYNGGRWSVQTVLWTEQGLAANDPLPVLKSYTDVQTYRNLGHLAIAPGHPQGGPDYFECPLLPIH